MTDKPVDKRFDQHQHIKSTQAARPSPAEVSCTAAEWVLMPSSRESEQARGQELERLEQVQGRELEGSAMDGSGFDAAWLGAGGNAGDDAWLEKLLKADAAFQPHVADGGFSARVMQSLPMAAAEQSAAPRWLLPLATVLACAITAVFTPAVSYFVHGLTSLVERNQLSAANLLVLIPVAVLYGCSFASLRD
jgi:hypothetical protein